MAKQRRDVWVCDAPGCPITVPVSEDAPTGYSGKVSTQGGSGCLNEPFWACRSDHIEPAILWVAKMAHEEAWR